MFDEGVQPLKNIFKVNIGCCWFLIIIKVRTEEGIQSGISKVIKGRSVYNMLFSNIPETKLFKPFIIFSLSEIKDTVIPLYIW